MVFQKNVVADAATLMTEQWTLVDTWQDLVQMGTSMAEATLVFGLRDIANLEELARLLYELRQRRGKVLRIIVFEMAQMLRRQDEELLMLCGASGVFREKNLSRRLQRVDEINRQPSRYQLAPNLEQAIALSNPMPVCGVLSTTDFVHHLRKLLPHFTLTQKDTFHLGLLMELTPMPSIRAEHLLSQFNLDRQGDIACLANEKIYVFLFGCLPYLYELVLQRVLALPYNELIAYSQTYLDHYSIETLLNNIEKYPSTPAAQEKKIAHHGEA